MLYLGIDNGSTGGIAVIGDDGHLVRADKTPTTEAELLALLFGIVEGRKVHAFAVLEHAQAFPRMGACSAFTYGQGYGAVKMALTAAAIPFDIVTPAKWQKALSCLSGGDKNVTKRRAEQLFPGRKITHAIADALLMAEYCRRLKLGQLNQPSAKE
jgi:Holliday junction resolvasome RuvABC endonuclease subunit